MVPICFRMDRRSGEREPGGGGGWGFKVELARGED